MVCDDFMTLIPKGTGFKEEISADAEEFDPCAVADEHSGSNSDDENEPRFHDAEELKSYFYKAAGYSGKCTVDMERMLYLKPVFICNRGVKWLTQQDKQSLEKKKRLLKILVADRDVIFKDGDDVFRSRSLNAYAFSGRKKDRREQYSSQSRENMVEDIVAQNKNRSVAPDNVKKLLTAIIEEAAIGKRTVYNWLYSKCHIGITDQNREDYEEKYKVDKEGYICEDMTPPKSSREWSAFRRWLKDRKNPWDTWCLDLSKCTADFKKLLRGCNTDFLTEEFTEIFIQMYLVEYILRCQNRDMKSVEEERYCDKKQANENFKGFQQRYKRLSRLERGFEQCTSKLAKKGEIDVWGVRSTGEKTEDFIKIEQAIVDFFEKIGLPLKNTEESHLLNRINWVCTLEAYQKAEKPMLLLTMVLQCGKMVTSSNDIEFRINGYFPYSSTHIFKDTQRYAQIELMNQLHQILALTEEEQLRSWNVYFACQGKEILSQNEFVFWRKFLLKNGEQGNQMEYGRLPVIGFQLRFLDDCDNCMPLHCEKLSYRLLSEAHRFGYSEFYKKNCTRIEALSHNVTSQNVKEYTEVWNSLDYTNEERLECLKRICSKHAARKIMKLCPNEEYQCLVMETAIRLCIRKEAEEKLYRWFTEIYNCNLSKTTAKLRCVRW